MSFHKSCAVVQASTSLTRAQKDVLAYLTSSAETYGHAWPSYETIMQSCDIRSRDTISTALKALKLKGYLKIVHGARNGSKNLSNRYFIIPQVVKPKKIKQNNDDQIPHQEIIKSQNSKQIDSLKAARAILMRSGAMDQALGVAIAGKLQELTSVKSLILKII